MTLLSFSPLPPPACSAILGTITAMQNGITTGFRRADYVRITILDFAITALCQGLYTIILAPPPADCTGREVNIRKSEIDSGIQLELK